MRAGLAERREADLRLGRTSWGPHLDDVRICFDGRPLRRYGSQGQQRLACWRCSSRSGRRCSIAGGPAPLLLLDDVMSELDGERRERLSISARGWRAGADHARPRQAPSRRGSVAEAVWMPAARRRPPDGGGLMGRRSPRPAAEAVRDARDRGRAGDQAGGDQAVWAAAVGPDLAGAAEPVSERGRHRHRALREHRLGRGAGDDGTAAAGPTAGASRRGGAADSEVRDRDAAWLASQQVNSSGTRRSLRRSCAEPCLFMRDLQGFCLQPDAGSGEPGWYPLCQLDRPPRPCAPRLSGCAMRSGFSVDSRKGTIA